MTKLQFLLARSASLLWVRPTLLSLAAVCWVGLSLFADNLLPRLWSIEIEKETLVNLFTILASTMLTVATFSVSAVAAAFGSVATSATPRATSIVMSDSGVQSTLAAFLAAFIYAVVSITALSALTFGAAGRFMLFVGFTLLVGWVLMSFLSWVDRVSRLGKLGDTLDRVSRAARSSLANPDLAGVLGGRSQEEDGVGRPTGSDAHVVRFDRFGYVQHLDMEGLQALMESLEGELWLDIRPGSTVSANGPIGVLRTSKKPGGEEWEKLRRCVTVGNDRSYETDPRFAVILLAEIASRALSPAVNDPGTAIAVLAVQVEMYHVWSQTDLEHRRNGNSKFDRIFIAPITPEDLVLDGLAPIARDGAGMIEVCIRLQKALRALMHMEHEGLSQAAREYRECALELARAGLPVESQKAVVEAIAQRDL